MCTVPHTLTSKVLVRSPLALILTLMLPSLWNRVNLDPSEPHDLLPSLQSPIFKLPNNLKPVFPD